jgi:hypothetical protein
MPSRFQRFPLPVNVPPDDRWCVQIQIPADAYYMQQFIGAISTLATWHWYERDELKRGKDIAALWKEALNSINSCAPEPVLEQVIHETITKGGTAMGCGQLVQKFGDTWHLGIDCGCGQIEWIPLGMAAAISADGTPLPVEAGDSGSLTPPPIGEGVSPDCYPRKAVDYLLDRAIDWGHGIVDWSALGVDAFTDLDEFVNAAELLFDLIAGEDDVLEVIKGMTKQAITDAFTDSEFRTKMYDLWNFEGKVNRAQLALFFGKATGVIGTLMGRGTYLQRWLQSSIIWRYNNALAQLAAECNSGVSSPLNIVPSIVAQNADFEIWRIQPTAESLVDLLYTGDVITVADLSPITYPIIATGFVLRPLVAIPTGGGALEMVIDLQVDGVVNLSTKAGTNRWIDGSLDFRYLGGGNQPALDYLNGVTWQTFTSGFTDDPIEDVTPTGYPLDIGLMSFKVRATPAEVKLRVSDIYLVTDKLF